MSLFVTEEDKAMSPVQWTPDRQQPYHDTPCDWNNNSFVWQDSTASSNSIIAYETPVRYVDERTKALGRKAELEALRRRNEIALKKAAFNADSPIATSTFASFFQQQQQRRMLATQLRLGALSSLKDYRLRDCGAMAKTAKRRSSTSTMGSPSAYSKMADIDHFFGVEWRERKKEAFKRLQLYRQQELNAKQRSIQELSDNASTEDAEPASPQSEQGNDKHSISEQEDTVTAHFLDSILLVHAELKGFFTAASSPEILNHVEAPADDEQHNLGEKEVIDMLAVDGPRWHGMEATNHLLSGDHGEMDIMSEGKKEPRETDALLTNCDDLMAQADTMLHETDRKQQNEPICISEHEDTEKLARDSCQSNAMDDNLPLNLHPNAGTSTDETIKKVAMAVREERSSLTGSDDVPRSRIEEHMRDIVAMQASLSFSKSDLQGNASPSHDDGSAQGQRSSSSPPLLDPMCGPRLNFVSDLQTDAVGKDSKSTSTDPVHDALHPNYDTNDMPQQMQCVSLASHAIPATDDSSIISSIGSSIDEKSAAGDGMLSRQSSASSLSSFWRQDFEPKQNADSDKRNQYNATLLMCDSEQYLPNLHSTKGACERCFSIASTAERVKFLATGRHVRIMLVRGGCHRSCTAYPRRDDQPPVRLCRKCYFDCHRAPKK